jgi:hypothetical protein
MRTPAPEPGLAWFRNWQQTLRDLDPPFPANENAP